jgi:hypothetical protein
VFDLGKNFAGWIRMDVAGAAWNQSIFMKYGELTFPNGIALLFGYLVLLFIPLPLSSSHLLSFSPLRSLLYNLWL